MPNWFFDKGAEAIQVGKIDFSRNGVGAIGHPISHTLYKYKLKMDYRLKI